MAGKVPANKTPARQQTTATRNAKRKLKPSIGKLLLLHPASFDRGGFVQARILRRRAIGCIINNFLAFPKKTGVHSSTPDDIPDIRTRSISYARLSLRRPTTTQVSCSPDAGAERRNPGDYFMLSPHFAALHAGYKAIFRFIYAPDTLPPSGLQPRHHTGYKIIFSATR
ncbi:MAG: hypothetical protein ACYC1T_04050 [Sulfuricaulis sp.]